MEHSIKNVLAATGFSKTGNNAVMAAIDICKQNNAVLHLLHVVDNGDFLNVAENGLDASIVNEMGQEARSQLYNMYERIIKEHEIMVRIHMPAGSVFEEICKAAWELPIDLIVMGDDGLRGWKEFFTSSTAFKVIKNSARPVLTIPSTFVSCKFKNILFPVRPTRGIIEKYRFIQPFIQKNSFIQIAVLCPLSTEEERFSYQIEVAEILMSLKNGRIDCSVEMYSCSNPASKALELCREFSADLLVINTNLRYNKWKQFFAGPYTKQILNHAGIPVLNFCFPEEAGENKKENKLARSIINN